MSSSKRDIGVVLAVFLAAALGLLAVLRLFAFLMPYDRLAWSPAPTFWGWLALSCAVLVLSVSLYRAQGGVLAASLVLIAS